MAVKVIDISTFQETVDWEKVAKTDIKGVMIRCGFRSYITGRLTEDNMYRKHVEGARKTDLKIGVYFFTEAITEDEARYEAEFTADLIKAMKLKPYFPIAVDTEAISDPKARANNLTREKRTACVKAFCERIKELGYTPMIYASTSWLNNKLDMSKLPYDVWVAQYSSECQYKGKYVMWQYTDNGRVDGIPGAVDISYDYKFIKETKKMATVKWKGNLTKHFTIEEYTVGNAPTATLTITERAYHFAMLLEEFRVWLDRPMIVTSWKRSEALNKKVGGISTSNHLTGTACDWHTNITITQEKFIKYAKKWKKICKKHGFVGEAGLYTWGMHLGIQNTKQAKANGEKFFHWDSRSGKQKNNPFKI